MRELEILILALYIDLPLEDNTWKKSPTSRVNIFNQSNPFIIA
jgi:hypothetical protein